MSFLSYGQPMTSKQTAADKANTHQFVHQIFSAHVHGIPLVGIVIIAFAAAAVLSRLIKAMANLAVVAGIIIAVVVFAPTLLGKKNGTELQQKAKAQEQALLNCKKQLDKRTASRAATDCAKRAEKAASAASKKK